MLYGHLPPLRAVVVVLAVLIGAYGLEPGALTTVLLLIMYATARYAAVTGLAWFRFTRRRMRGITPVKLLDDTRMLAFQRVTLRIFDLPHHPRRLRQAVRRWREWRTNREHVLEMNARRRGNTAVHDRGDGLANLHDPDSYHLHDKTAGDETPRAGGHGRNTNSSDPGFEPRTSRTSDHIDSLSHAIERSPAYAALEACALTRALHPDVLRQLANNCMREVHVAAGEDVYRGRVLEDELAVLVAGTVAVGDDRAHAVGFGGDQRMGVESMMSGASHDGIDSAAEPTVLSRPGTCVTSLLDVLEGSQRVARGASAAPSVAPSVAPSIAGDLNDDTRSEAGSVATLPPTDLTWEKDSHTGVNAKDAADPGEPAPGEPRTVTLKRLAEAAAAAHASVAVGGGGGSGAHFSAHGADSPAGSDSGIGSGVTAATTDGEHNRAVVATSPGDSSAGAHAPPPTHVDRPPSHIPPASVASASVASGHSPRSSHPTTPTRGGPRGSGLSASRVGAAVAARILYPGVNPAEAVIGSGVPGHLPHHRTALEFSGGPGGLPRPRVRGGDGGCVLAVIPLADFHKAAGFQLGVQAAAMRLNGGYTALCHYLCMPNELGRLWVDGPDRVHGMSNDKSMIGGATFALARLLGPTAASQVDKSGLDYLLERRGYKPRRKSAGHYERPPSDGDDDIGVDSDTDRDSLASSTRMDTGPTGSHAGGNHKSDTSRTRVGHKAGPGSRGAGSGSNVTGATGRAGNTTVELEACELAPGELAKVRGSSNYLACLLVERGSLEGYWSPPDGRHGSGTAPGVTPRAKGKRSGKRHVRVGRERPGEDGNGFNTPRCFVAGPGCSVGGFLLLTGQKAAMTVRAGPGGAVIAALPHSAVARLARAHPHVYAHVATELARRLRPALPARLWDRCGAEWCALRAGEALVNSARGMSHAGRHPEGVYVVATGCVRLAGDPAGSTHGDGGHSNGHSADHPHPHASSVNSAMGHGVTDDGEGEAGVTRARFLGPGEAVGEDTVLRGVDGEAYGESGGFGRGNSGLKGPSRNGRDRGTHAASFGSELSRARAVRDAQLLWIPSAGLEALAAHSPRAFVSLAWRMGSRARGRSGSSSSPGGAQLNKKGADGLFSAAGISGTHSNHPGLGVHKGGQIGATLDETPFAPRTVAVVPVSEGAALALDEFVGAVHAALSRTCAARVADSALRLAEVGQAGVGPLANEATAHWLAQLEAANDVVLLKADPFPSRWCVTCARHADAILLVAAAEDDEAPGPHEGHALQARLLGGVHGGGLAQRELVLLHNSTEVTPTGTRPWLEAFSVHRHHHAARAPAHGLAPAHAARLARSLRRQSVGLVLAGGGARGFAHVGVLMALEEEGVPVDLLGGTSMGSFVGGLYAKEPTALLTRIIARRLAVHMSSTWNQLMDLTIPVVSYFSGFRMNKVLEPLFRGAKIEDCWLPFFCMTLDLVSCVPIVHRNGTLWRYVRASMALVGFLPPLCDWAPREAAGAEGTDPSSPRTSLDGKTAESAARTSMNDRSELPDDTKPTRGRRLSRVGRQEPGKLHVLVDGGYVNNCPTDVMRAMGARVIVAVDVSGHGLPESRMKPWGDAISGFTLIAKSWLPQWLGGGPSCPTMAAMQSHLPYITDYANAKRRWRTVDVMVRPRVTDVPILAFNRYAEVVRAGHEAGLRAIRAWKVANPDVLPILDDGMWRPSGPPGDRGVLREVGSKGRLNQRGMASARLPSTETLSRGAGPGRIGSVGGSSSGGWSGTDLNADGYTGRAGSPNVPNAEMVEAMERDPFGLGLAGGIGSQSSALHLNEDDYVERHASRRVRVEHSHRAAYNAEHLLKDADARRVEVRRMEGAMGDHGSDGVGHGSDEVPESGWTRNPLHHRDEDDEEDGAIEGGHAAGRDRTEQWLTRVGSAPREFLTPDQPRVRGRKAWDARPS